ncbi:MAG: hypothetical protein KKC46_03860 [Proteobacteria bacterium]|nr:hypothetical protein [Pseudomonadota bacterium]
MSETHKLSCIVARNLSGLQWSPMEVTNETDRDATSEHYSMFFVHEEGTFSSLQGAMGCNQ